MSKITHEQAREVMMKLESEDVYYGEYIEEHKIIATYIKQQERTPLIHFDNANHFRNAFYNAPIGTVEHEIANKLNELEKLKRYFELHKLLIGMLWNGTDEEWEEYKSLKQKLSK